MNTRNLEEYFTTNNIPFANATIILVPENNCYACMRKAYEAINKLSQSNVLVLQPESMDCGSISNANCHCIGYQPGFTGKMGINSSFALRLDYTDGKLEKLTAIFE